MHPYCGGSEFPQHPSSTNGLTRYDTQISTVCISCIYLLVAEVMYRNLSTVRELMYCTLASPVAPLWPVALVVFRAKDSSDSDCLTDTFSVSLYSSKGSTLCHGSVGIHISTSCYEPPCTCLSLSPPLSVCVPSCGVCPSLYNNAPTRSSSCFFLPKTTAPPSSQQFYLLRGAHGSFKISTDRFITFIHLQHPRKP